MRRKTVRARLMPTVGFTLFAVMCAASPGISAPTAPACYDTFIRPEGYVTTQAGLRHLMHCAQQYPGLAERLIVVGMARQKQIARSDALKQSSSAAQNVAATTQPLSAFGSVIQETGAVVLGPHVQQAADGHFRIVQAPANASPSKDKAGTVPASQNPDSVVSSTTANAVLNLNAAIDNARQAIRSSNMASANSTASNNNATGQALSKGCPYRKNALATTSGLVAIARSTFLRDIFAATNLLAPLPFSPCEPSQVYKPVLQLSDQHPYVKEAGVTAMVTERGYVGSFLMSSDDSTVLSVAPTAGMKNTWTVTLLAQGAANIIVTDENGNQNQVAVLVDAPKQPTLAITLSDAKPFVGETGVTITISEPGSTTGFSLRSDNTAILSVAQVAGKQDTWSVTMIAAGTANLIATDDQKNTTSLSVPVAATKPTSTP